MFSYFSDQRTRSWFLVAKPYQGLTLLGLYLMLVLKWGPQWMKDRKPFNLDKIMIVYNILQVVCNAYLFYAVSLSDFIKHAQYFCNNFDKELKFMII